MRLGRKKKKVQPSVEPEAPARTIFGEVIVPEMYAIISHEGIEIYPEFVNSRIKNFCTSCGGDVQFSNDKSWQEIISQSWTCGDCVWLRDKYEDELRRTSEEIEKLDCLRDKLFAAFAGLLGHKPASLEVDDLREAGLILHRQNTEAVLGFILIDYSREQMHQFVTAVNGRLEPFSRGFQLFLPVEYYKLFPGSFHWSRSYGGMYLSYIDRSHLDRLRQLKAEIEARAEPILARIAEHEGSVNKVVTH